MNLSAIIHMTVNLKYGDYFMSKNNSNNEENTVLINNNPTENEESKDNDEKKCCSVQNAQTDSKVPKKTTEHQSSFSSSNIPPENMKAYSSAEGESSNSVPDISSGNTHSGPLLKQQGIHPVKNILFQIWNFVEGLIKALTSQKYNLAEAIIPSPLPCI